MTWWIKRVRFALELYDAVRIDHFRGFDTYYAIPYGAPNARKGEWRQGPGMRLWREVLRAVPGAGHRGGGFGRDVRKRARAAGMRRASPA